MRRCLDCSMLTAKGSRCPRCEKARQSKRNAGRAHYSGDYSTRRGVLLNHAAVVGAPCAICGKPIDYTLKWPDPMSPTADHLVPGDPKSLLRPAHARCNSSRGNRAT